VWRDLPVLGARHKGTYTNPEGGSFPGACALHKTPLCYIPPHTDDRHSRPCLITALWKGIARTDYPTPATCKWRALDGVAGFGEAMKGDGVKRLRKEEIAGRDNGCEAEGGVYRRLRSSRLSLP